MQCTTGATAGAGIFGVPVYVPFLRVDTIINGQVIESVNQYNQVAHMYVNCNTDIAGKCAVQYAYGYLAADDSYISPWDGRLMGQSITVNTALPNNANYSVSAPIICNILTNCEKLIPSFLLQYLQLIRY